MQYALQQFVCRRSPYASYAICAFIPVQCSPFTAVAPALSSVIRPLRRCRWGIALRCVGLGLTLRRLAVWLRLRCLAALHALRWNRSLMGKSISKSLLATDAMRGYTSQYIDATAQRFTVSSIHPFYRYVSSFMNHRFRSLSSNDKTLHCYRYRCRCFDV